MASNASAEGGVDVTRATYAIRADHFVLPGRVCDGGYLTVYEGRFGLWTPDIPKGMDLVDESGCWIAPGFVDTHIHGFFGHAATDLDPDGLGEAGLELARRGTTSWLPTTFTDDVERIGRACASIAEAAQGQTGAAARIQGIYLEGPFFTQKHVGAQNPAYLIDPSLEVFDRWQELAGGIIRKSALAPERDGSKEYVAGLVERGVVSCIGHSDATYEEASAAVDAGASCFVHTFNGMRGLHHREPGVVGCAMVSNDTYAELICDGKHVSAPAMKALVRAKGWEHVVPITDCLACGGLEDGSYTSGGMDVVLKDGLCYLSDMSSIAGSVLTLAQGVKNLYDWQIASAEQAIRMATEVAARSAGIADRCGAIVCGRPADYVVLNEGLGLEATYLGGRLAE